MKVIILMLSTFFFFINKTHSQLTKRVKRTIIYQTDLLPDSFRNELSKVVNLYNNKYGLTYDTLYIDKVSIPPKIYKNGSKEIVNAQGKYKKIYFNEFASKEWTISEFKDIVKHELFHTLGKDTIRVKPFFIQDKDSVIGFLGLGMIIKLGTTGQITGLKKLEEASAEVCAIRIGQGYIQGGQYFGVTAILNYLIEFKYITEKDLAIYASRSDMTGLIKKILNISMVKINDIMNFYDIIENLWNIDDICFINKATIRLCLLRSKSEWVK